VECQDLDSFIWWSQVKQRFEGVKLSTFHDPEREEAAPLSHQLLAVSGPQGLLGVRQWSCEQ
jgi:hypothetical protein